MTYDFHGTWERVTGHNSPLYRGSEDNGDLIYFNTVRAFKCQTALNLVAGQYCGLLSKTTTSQCCHSLYLFQDFAMKYWRDNGTPSHKLRLGFATYGRTFRLSSSNTAIGAPASGAASAGAYTREAGFWAYYEVKFKSMHIDISTGSQWHQSDLT